MEELLLNLLQQPLPGPQASVELVSSRHSPGAGPQVHGGAAPQPWEPHSYTCPPGQRGADLQCAWRPAPWPREQQAGERSWGPRKV